MWQPRRLTTPCPFKACYRDSFTLPVVQTDFDSCIGESSRDPTDRLKYETQEQDAAKEVCLTSTQTCQLLDNMRTAVAVRH
jgi:hypothetical protein